MRTEAGSTIVSSQLRAVVWWMCFESASASQRLLSQSRTMCLGFLLHQQFRHPLRGHLFAQSGLVSALYEGELDPSSDRRRRSGIPGQAASKQLRDRVLQLAVLLDGADLDGTHQIIRQVEGCFHAPILPAIWFSGKKCR